MSDSPSPIIYFDAERRKRAYQPSNSTDMPWQVRARKMVERIIGTGFRAASTPCVDCQSDDPVRF